MRNIKNWLSLYVSRSWGPIIITGVALLILGVPESQSQEINADSLESVIASPIALNAKKEALLILARDFGLESPDKALTYVDSLYLLMGPDPEPGLYARVSGYEAAARRFSGDYKGSLRLWGANYNYYKSIDDSTNVAYCADNIGTMKMFQGSYAASQELYHEALDIYEALGLEDDISDMNIGLGNLYSYLEENDKAISYYKEALQYYQSKEDLMGQSDVHANIGLTYISMKDFAKAEYHLLQEGRLDSLLESQWGLGFFHDYMGILRRDEKRYDEALQYFFNSLSIREELQSNFNINESKISLGSLLNDMKRHKEAITHLQHVIDNQKEEQSLSQQQSAYEGLAEAYGAIGNYKYAYDYHQQFKTVSDSVLNKDKLETILEKDAKYERVAKDKEILELQLTDEVKSNQLVNQSRWLGSLIMGIGILGFLLYRLFGQKSQIESQNKIISKALTEKDTLLREIHHRVKNNLQVISSLLRIQSSHTEDEVALDALKEGQSRVQSMSLIHQDLYQKDNLTGIRMQTYLSRLSQNLFDTYNISHDRIKLSSKIADIHLDVDTVVPLGLMINELVTNALKYAFPEDRHGVISIELAEQEEVLVLIVKDDGIGIPNPEEVLGGDSFGYSLINAFASKLEAELSIENDGGTVVMLTISNYKMVTVAGL